MCYDEDGGSFPFTYKEIELTWQLLSEKSCEMEKELERKDPHTYLRIQELCGKFAGILKLMDCKRKIDTCEYKGFKTEIKYSRADNCYYGKLEGIRDLVNFEGQTKEEALQNFQVSVDDYLETVKTMKELEDEKNHLVMTIKN